MASVDEAAIAQIFREEYGRCLASLIRSFGDIDLAEDVVQDAFAIAADRWPSDGPPPNPGAWITTTARNRAIDRLRRTKRGQELERVASVDESQDQPQETGPVSDDRLRLIFTCCHPALSREAQVALTLRLLGGLTTADVAAAFLVPEATMAKRLVRAKHKIKAARIPYRIPTEPEMVDRLGAVLAVLYLVYNAGSSDPTGAELRREALRLTRTVASLMPDAPEVKGLLALLLLSESRQPARFDDEGSIIRLADQDRARWDRALIEEGQALLRACQRHDEPGPYQLQAAINAVHSDAASIDATDWQQIVGLYDHLLELSPTPVVALNRAIAVAEVRGAAAALELIDELDLDGYYLFHATRADLLRRLAQTDEAALAYARAASLAPTTAERSFLDARLADLRRL